MTQTYKTIKSRSESLYKEKGSKFIGIAVPVKTEEDIKNRLEDIRKEYHDSRHVCYAWMLGYERDRFRANDDGEPSNSAGKPILGQIESFGLTNVLIAVVRYFGGTKLGVGGLISAYKIGAKEALEVADLVEESVKKIIEIQFDYNDMPMVMNFVKEYKFEIVKQDFENYCTLAFLVELDQVEFVNSKLEDFKSLEKKKEEII
jgi:uncharacterized YigZ family protein